MPTLVQDWGLSAAKAGSAVDIEMIAAAPVTATNLTIEALFDMVNPCLSLCIRPWGVSSRVALGSGSVVVAGCNRV
ncbi:uncharacterized protein RMCC_4016 [Mycolicibacterium canariasense]|uniref:Uncharacterized protein n=1 Tax=Mycolicibacterium canariasense TaxID=228230 RepID=A0A117IAX7_MYCCR|nr:hypothetical protein [Mycolicibacterium canariasense]MCV7213414.1 hypothetical protein [Mycolicibacterium canariasense]GAS97050.1 uncharacterized protein RMCC_4016 [Mycolicibacterium canariasense]